MGRAKLSSSLRKLFGKGRIDVLLFIDEKGSARFSDIRKFCLDHGVVRSRGTIPIILRTLTGMKLVERKVAPTRPVQTFYEMTQLGKQILEHLKSIQHLLGG